MEPIAERTARLVGRQPLPALPLQEVRHLLRQDSPGPAPDEEFLLSTFRRRPDLFRILDPWQGAWCDITAVRPEAGSCYLPRLREQGISPRWPWVVVFSEEPAGWPGEGGNPPCTRALVRLRESVAALSREVDGASVLALTRWCRLLNEQRALMSRVAAHPES